LRSMCDLKRKPLVVPSGRRVRSIQVIWKATGPIFQAPMSEAQADFEAEFRICAWAKTVQSVHVYS